MAWHGVCDNFCTYMYLITDMITLPHPSWSICDLGVKGQRASYVPARGGELWKRDSLQTLDLLRLGSLDNDEWRLGIIKQPS